MNRRNRNMVTLLSVVSLLLPSLSAGVTKAAIVPFTEDFSTGSANWTDNASAPLSWNATDSFVTGNFNFLGSATNDFAIVFRGHQAVDPVNSASGGAFVGDWISDGVTELSFSIRHDAGVPLEFFSRTTIASPPVGVIGDTFIPVPTNTWVPITIAIDPSNPNFTFEFGNFASIFSSIANVQFGVYAPADLAGVDQVVNFSLDNVSIVPEPTSLLLLAGGALVLARCRRRKGA